MIMKFTTKEITGKHPATIVEFDLDGEMATREMLATMAPPEINPRHGVIISGRGPVWLFAALVHHYHPSAWQAIDPRLGAVVVESHHTSAPDVGSIVELND
jgi:CRISPR-associated protein Csx3